MKTILCLLGSLVLLCQSVTAQSRDSIHTIVEKEAVQFMNSKAAVGLSLGIYKDGQLYLYNYGSTSTDAKQMPTEHTIYGIASITKTFTGLLLAKAADEKKVNIGDDIRDYLDGEYPNLEYKGNPIRLFHLISHVSRLPMWLSDRAEKPGYSRADFYHDLHQVKIDTLPGVKFQYSNAAAQLLGYILEKVYNKSLEELIREKISNPLQMTATRIILTDKEKKEAAKGYTNARMYDPNMYDYLQGGGGLKSTVSDLLKYIGYQMNEKDSAVALSHKESWGFDMGGNSHYSCALNWQIFRNANAMRRISQNGDLVNCSSIITFCPELNTGIVVLTNSNNIDAVAKIADGILKAIAPGMY